jgi:hypothetical protein
MSQKVEKRRTRAVGTSQEAPYGTSLSFVGELLHQVASLGAVAEEHGARALAFLLYLLAAPRGASGRRTWNVVRPGRESTRISPPCRWTTVW